MKKYDIIVSGSVIRTFDNKEEAEKFLALVKKGPLSWVHPQECMRIKER